MKIYVICSGAYSDYDVVGASVSPKLAGAKFLAASDPARLLEIDELDEVKSGPYWLIWFRDGEIHTQEYDGWLHGDVSRDGNTVSVTLPGSHESEQGAIVAARAKLAEFGIPESIGCLAK